MNKITIYSYLSQYTADLLSSDHYVQLVKEQAKLIWSSGCYIEFRETFFSVYICNPRKTNYNRYDMTCFVFLFVYN